MRTTIRKLPKDLFRSITWDQGKEKNRHADFTVDTGIQIFFCDPHSPWQRGSDENTNGLLHLYMSKGTDPSALTRGKLRRIEKSLKRPPPQDAWIYETIRETNRAFLRSPLESAVSRRDSWWQVGWGTRLNHAEVSFAPQLRGDLGRVPVWNRLFIDWFGNRGESEGREERRFEEGMDRTNATACDFEHGGRTTRAGGCGPSMPVTSTSSSTGASSCSAGYPRRRSRGRRAYRDASSRRRTCAGDP